MTKGIIFVVEPGDLEQKAILLASSLRYFGHINSGSTIFALNPGVNGNIDNSVKNTLRSFNVELIEEQLNFNFRFYPLANKILTASWFENRFDQEFDSLVFLDTDLLVLNDVNPLFSPNNKLKVKPEERRNTGLLMAEAPNKFWKMIFEHCGVDDYQKVWEVKSSVEQEAMRALYNPSVIVKKSGNDFFQTWLHNFEKLMADKRLFKINYLQFYFIELSVFSATAVQFFRQDEIEELKHQDNYPIHLHDKIEQPARNLNDINILHYHNHLRYADGLKDFQVSEDYEQWLSNYLPQQTLNKGLIQRVKEILSFQKHKLKYKYNLL
ncbi:MAG: hypothetical protein RJQ09_19855 [Cyclobacteriaceae bacterium]